MMDQTVRDDDIELAVVTGQRRSVCLLQVDSAGELRRLDMTAGAQEQGRRSIDGGDDDVVTLATNVDGDPSDPRTHVKDANSWFGRDSRRVDERQEQFGKR
jgi:hypothetical protein